MSSLAARRGNRSVAPLMRVSLSWISRLLGVERLPIATSELQQLLTLRTTEVESEIERTGPGLDGVVVGKVLTVGPHPNADRLRVTTVDIGGPEPLPIVCGAPNVAVGQTVAVATIGTTLTMTGPDGQAKPLTIKAGKLRGEPSHGMICAEDELGLGTGHDGILVLDGRHPAGLPLTTALGLGDEVFVIDNHGISNRPDLWGQVGWAREIAALTGRPAPVVSTAWTADPGPWRVEISDDGCTTYCGALVEGVANRPSPRWLQEALAACGVRPLGLLVDVTNFVMLELGEPMHAFDRRAIAGEHISVRSALPGETFTTLDGKAHTLAAGDLLIADGARALALAGIMGGDGSMVREDTTAIVLEAAIFRSERIRRTRIRLGITTDSSARFEKGLYPELAPAAIARAIALLRAECPDLRVVQRFHAGATAQGSRHIAYDHALYQRVIGQALPAERQDQLLGQLGIARDLAGYAIPWWRRKDLHVAVDLVEEIARSEGLGLIAAQVPRLPAQTPVPNPLRAAEHRARRLLSAHGWDEVATYGFASDAWTAALAWDEATTIRLRNPLSAEWTVLRASLVPGLAEAVGRNRRHLAQVALYEVGKRYGRGIGDGDTPDEDLQLVGLYAAAGDETPFYAARDAALAVLRGLGHDAEFVAEARGIAADHPELTFGRIGTLLIAGKPYAWCSELPAAIRARAGCPERVGVFTLALERLVRHAPTPRPVAFAPPSRFQAVEREFTWACPEALPYDTLAELTRSASRGLCTAVELITVYRGAPYAAGEKAVSLKVVLQAADRTLDEKELAAVSTGITRAIEAKTLARVRAG